MAARGPRELEQATAKLLGVELRRVIDNEDQGLWFDWWFAELAEAVASQVKSNASAGGGAWQAPWRVLHGLTSIASPPLLSIVQAAIGHASAEAHKAQQDDSRRLQPAWLWKLPMIAATGEVWQMRDAYGSRSAIIAGFSYPGRADPSVFLFDIDACGPITLASPGVYDDLSQAVAAWRTLIGDAASGAEPMAVETAEDLRCLVQVEAGERAVSGGAPHALTENWFRARRRIHDLADAMGRRGMPLPAAESSPGAADPEPTVAAFARWHLERHGTEPDKEAVAALAEEWLAGALPGTEHAASPHRVTFRLAALDDRIEDASAATAAKALLPQWVRWHGEQAGLPEPLIARAVAVAGGEARAASDCPGAR
jgi:hypothetical protein